MAGYIKRHDGYCDFCGGEKGEFYKSETDNNRDLCKGCLMDAMSKFGINNPNPTGISSVAKSMFNNVFRKMVDKGYRTMVKAGFISECGTITSDGQNALLSIVLEEHKEEVVKMAEEVIAERKEDK